MEWNSRNTGVTIKYCIIYNNKIYTTTKTTFTLPIGYGVFERDDNGNIKLNSQGKPITQEECVRIETRYYFSDGSFSYGEDPIIFVFVRHLIHFVHQLKQLKL